MAAPPETQCPVCARRSCYVVEQDRYFHLDGTSNRQCWVDLVRRAHNAPTPDSPTCPHCISARPHVAGGLREHLAASYVDLVALIGPPGPADDTDKGHLSWRVATTHGPAVIYDYGGHHTCCGHCDRDPRRFPHTPWRWHVAATTDAAATEAIAMLATATGNTDQDPDSSVYQALETFELTAGFTSCEKPFVGARIPVTHGPTGFACGDCYAVAATG